MQSFAKGLCVRACLTWLVLVILVVSCTSPPSPTPSLLSQGQPVFLEKPSATLSLLEAPQALQTLSMQSKSLALQSQQGALPFKSKTASADFKIQLFVNAEGLLPTAPQISGSELQFDAYFGVYAWAFTAYFPEGVQSSWTTQLTRAANNPCGSSFFPSSSSLTPPDDGNPDTRAHAVTWLQAPDLNTIKNGAYIFTLTDDGGYSYTYNVNVTGGQPNACPTATPTPVPTPTPTPVPCKGNPKNCVSPTPTSTPNSLCPCQGQGFTIQANTPCPPCSEADRIPGKPCELKPIDPKTGKPLILKNVQKITFLGSYDFDRRQDRNSRDVELAFVIEPFGYNGGFWGNDFLNNISINNNLTLVNRSGPDDPIKIGNKTIPGQDPFTPDYQEKFRLDAITDAVYSHNTQRSLPMFGFFGSVPGCPKYLSPVGAFLMVSANLSVLNPIDQIITVTLPSNDRKTAFTAKLQLKKASDGSKNWERIDCVQ